MDGYVEHRAKIERWTAYIRGTVPALARTEPVQTVSEPIYFS
jgi:hypothetical protein